MNAATKSSELERWQLQPGDVLLVTDIQNDFLPGGANLVLLIKDGEEAAYRAACAAAQTVHNLNERNT